MQLLYSISRDEGLSKDQLIKEYWKRIEETYEMLLFNLFLIENIAKISAEDYEKRKGKHLPTEQDKLFLPLLWENDKIRSLAKNTKLHKVYQKVGFNAKVDQDHFRSIYSEFSKTETYTDAIGKTLNSDEILELLLELYRFCRGKELFNEMVEDHYANWESDKSLVVGSVKKILLLLVGGGQRLDVIGRMVVADVLEGVGDGGDEVFLLDGCGHGGSSVAGGLSAGAGDG